VEIEIEGTRFRTGRIIRNMLKGAEEYAFFAVTAGPEPETLSKNLMKEGQFLEGYIVDLIATGIVESVADQLQEAVKSAARKDGFRITNRYSPGYCTWDVAEQQKLFGLLPGGCCGITLSESSLMLPIKSVSGIIGIGKEVKYRGYSCEHCSIEQCACRRVDRPSPGFVILRNRWSSRN
jgi:cobalamin-dependent methionine synthase I